MSEQLDGQRPLTADDFFEGGELYVGIDATRWRHQVYVRQLNHPRTLFREATGIQWTEPRRHDIVDGGIDPDPILMELGKKQAQQLMDDLWHTGIRPSEIVVDDKGTIAAQQANLVDLRKVVFNHLLPNAFIQSTEVLLEGDND